MTTSLATPTLHLTPASDTGVSHSDGITDDTVPVIAGTATPGALVTITDANSGLSVQARADKYGNYVAVFAGLQAGVHGLTASATDANGNVSPTSNPLAINIETTATATITAPLVPDTAEAVDFAVHFDQPVSTLTPASFMLVTTGDAYGNVESVIGSGEDYTVTVAGLGGTGAVGLAFSADAPTDVAGNQVALSSVLHEVSDTTAGVLTTVSTDKSGVQGTGASPAPSSGGGTVAFISNDPDLVPGGQTKPGASNAYVKNLATGQIVQITNGNETDPILDVEIFGSTVAFSSRATDLVPGGTPSGQLNLYVAELTATSGVLSLEPGSIKLVGALNPSVYIFDEAGFALSGDSNTLAYEGDTTLADGTTDAPGEFIYNLNTGVTTQFQFAASGDGTSLDSGNITSISYNGTRIAYTASVPVPGTGGEPDIYTGGTVAPNLIQDAFVYDTTTKTTFTIDGSGLLPGTNPPTGENQSASYVTQYPVLSGDGSTVVFQLARFGQDAGVSLFSVNLANPSVFSPVSPGASSGGGADNDHGQSVSQTGAVIEYTSEDPTTGPRIRVYTPATDTTTDLGVGYQAVLTSQGNAVVYDEPTDETGSQAIIYEQTLGVSASSAPIDGDDAINAMQLKQAKAAGLAVSGTTNAPPGSAVLVYVSDKATPMIPANAVHGVVGDDGTWTATIPAAVAATLTDGDYGLFVQVQDAYGASYLYDSVRVFNVDTQIPAQPAIPQLDPGSAAGLGQNGTPLTNTATPTIDGVAEPLSLVSLYTDNAAGVPVTVASARADQNGVYVITAPPLADGIQYLEVQAVDAAGNPSPFSSSLEIIVDTTPPPPPPTPTLLYYSDSPDGPVTDVPRLSVIGTAEPNSDVTLFDAITGDVLATDVVVGADGTYAATTHELDDGKYAVAAYAKDQAGNVGKPSQYGADVTIDTQAPDAPTIASVSGGTASDGSLSPSLDISGDAEPFSQVTLLVDGAPDTIDRAVTADEDGAFDLQTTDLPAGAHTLSVTATDFAGNVSSASAPTTVTISDTAVEPPGAPFGTVMLNGIAIDGPIAGATVFADANGNGMRDADEGLAVTGTDGGFALADTGGPLIASGGTDTETGLPLPGALDAPAGSTVIDPLTTLLTAYAAATGQTPQAAQPALLAILGLDPAADLTQINPETAASGGDPSVLIADAKVIDSVVVLADLIAAQTGVSPAAAFAASVTALAQQAATGALDLQTYATDVVNAATAAAAIADPGFVLPNGLAEDAAIVIDNGNYDLANVSGQTDPSAVLTMVEAIERVEQGQAAPQLAAASGNQAAADLVAQTYSSGLSGAVSSAETPALAAPVLTPSDDTGVSAQDGVTSDKTPTFMGKAPPGATVILARAILNAPGSYIIVGSGVANADGAYTVATTLPAGRDVVLAFQATPGEATAAGTQFGGPVDLTDAQVTQVTVGDLSVAGGTVAPPTIDEVHYAASSANDAAATSLYLTGESSYTIDQSIGEGAFYTVTANGAPVTAAPAQDDGGGYGLQTTPLAAGTYSLVVTETGLDGESVQSAPVTVTLTAPGSLGIQAEAAGPVAGGSITGSVSAYPELALPSSVHQNAITDTSGAASFPAQDTVPAQGSTLVYATDEQGLELSGGQDAATGLILPVNLFAPRGSSVITPATSLLRQADVDATPPETTATAADYAYENSRIDTALGLPTTVDLSASDPLAMAEAGNPALFLKDVELLDTIFLLIPFTVDGDAPKYTADPLYVIDQSLGILKFNGSLPPITTKPIDFTSAAEVLSWLTTYDNSGSGGSYDDQYDASVLPTAAAIIAAGNAAIEAHAAAGASLADTISYALAVERVTLSGEEQALAALAAGSGYSVAQQQAGFTTLQTEFTGSGLQAAVAAALAQTVQVTGFSPASASTGAAREIFTITFSAPVGGVTAGDFTVSGGAGFTGAAVTDVTPVAGSDGAAYAVTVATGVGQGTLTLSFTPNGLTSADGSPLTTGTFGTPRSYSTPLAVAGTESLPQALATGDFNGDGRTDVLIANGSADGLTLFLGQGDGGFVAEPAVYTGSNGQGNDGAFQIVTGDFNGDGKLDAVTLNYRYNSNGDASDLTVSTMLGDGEGGFAGPVQTDVGPYASNVVGGDFNGDGKLDLAVLSAPNDYSDATVQLFYGNGDGTFSAGPTTDAGAPLDLTETYVDRLVAADLNGDGKTDLAFATRSNTTGDPGVAILLGNGQGGFNPAAQPALGLGLSSGVLIAAADVNGDGIPDIVAVPRETAGSETAAILLGKGDGTFEAPISAPLALPPGSASGASLDGDDENVAVAVGDVTGDGKPDVVVENSASGVVVAPGQGDGTFGPSYTDAAALPGSLFGQLTLADVNGDDRLDLIATQSGGDEAGSSTTSGIAVSLGTAQTVLPASASVTVNRAAEAQPALSQTSGGGTLTQSGTAYTLDLGTLAQGSTAAAVLALVNTATAPADSFDGTFSTPTGTGFTVAGATLPQPVAAGGSYGGLTFTADTSAPGTYSETITFAPRDATAIPAAATTPDPDGGDAALPAAAPVTDPVAAELPAITLTITDNVVAGGLAAASLAPVPAIALPNVRVGDTDSEAITISNSATAPAADLDVTATASGDATVSGSVAGLAPQASDTTSVVAGLGTSAAGSQSGTITLAPVSEPSTALADQDVAVTGSVYRPATAVVTPIAAVVHVGDAGLLSLGIANADVADGFSEDLDATLTSVSGPFSATAGESTGAVSAGMSSNALTVSFSTMAASVLTGSATIGFSSDGGAAGTGIDGLGTLALPSQTAPLAVTVDNYANASLQLLAGTGTLAASGTTYTLDLGTVAQGAAPLTEMLDVVNAASGPADLLSGHFDLSAADAIGLTGFGDFSGLASGQTDGGLDVSLDTSAAGTFTRTVTLTPTGSNASGYNAALTPETLTITGTVAPTATGTGSQPGTSTASTPPVYRFFDTIHGTHLFTASLSEAQNILSSRPDLMEETNNFGAVTPQTAPNAEAVYRFFEASNGTHFFTASYQEYVGLTTAGTPTYRPDLTYEPNSTFYEDATSQPGDVAVYRFFDTVQGTQYLTASQSEYAGLTTAGTSTYRPDLTPEGIAFYAPAGNFST